MSGYLQLLIKPGLGTICLNFSCINYLQNIIAESLVLWLGKLITTVIKKYIFIY